MHFRSALFLEALAGLAGAQVQEARIEVRADRVLHPVSPWLTGACIEDVNHEIYGGIYSQMIFGESFQEPPPQDLKGFRAYEGTWDVRDGELRAGDGAGPKLVSGIPGFVDGEVGVEVFFAERRPGNAGLIVRVGRPGRGADGFDGYEVALDPAAQILRLGRHQQNYQLIRDVPCEVPVGRWVALAAKLEGSILEVLVDGRSVVRHDDGQAALPAGTVGLRQWQREARYRNLWVRTGPERQGLAFEREAPDAGEVSGMWRRVRRGYATGTAHLLKEEPFLGAQSQRLLFTQGEGKVGVENRGLNRVGLYLAGGRPYEGLLWARTETACDLWVALESADGATVHAEQRLRLVAGDWQRLGFALVPDATETRGRFAITLRQPGSVDLGYAFLQPGAWGRFKDLPVRRDVAEALIDQGITVLRYGGSMVNPPEYRWKKMVGPRDRRPPYRGTWYPHSSNGWGIVDFMAFCEAAGFEYIPAFNLGERPQDMADFIDYAKAPVDSPWGRRRAADGHPEPFRLRYLELGNEERVDEGYAATFEALAKAIWAKDPEIILVVGDFVYSQPISDPLHLQGAASGITSLAGQQRILQLAKQAGREVWFDIHVGTDGPRPDATFAGMFSFRDALGRIADGARHRVAVFEFNAGNPCQRRALANALAIHAIERDGGIPVATSANCLQPDGQNDNGWDQGLLFLNPARVWLQPPGYVTRMFSRRDAPLLVQCQVSGAQDMLDVNAKRSEDGRVLVLQVVNPTDRAVNAGIALTGFAPRQAAAQVTELSGPLADRNTAEFPDAVIPYQHPWHHGLESGATAYAFRPRSVTVLRLE